MIPLDAVLSILKFLSIAGYGAIFIKLHLTRLNRVYRFFTGYVGVEFVRALIASFMDPRTTLYGYFYFATQALVWVLYMLTVLELFTVVLREHRGIATMGRWMVMGALGLSVAISFSTLALDVQRGTSRYPLLESFILLDRLVMCSLLIFVLLLTAFLAYFPVVLRRNALLHAGVFAIFFLAKTAGLFARNVLGTDATEAVNAVLISAACACLVAWIVLLKPAGEKVAAKAGTRWSADAEERLLAQLEAINKTLLGSAKE